METPTYFTSRGQEGDFQGRGYGGSRYGEDFNFGMPSSRERYGMDFGRTRRYSLDDTGRDREWTTSMSRGGNLRYEKPSGYDSTDTKFSRSSVEDWSDRLSTRHPTIERHATYERERRPSAFWSSKEDTGSNVSVLAPFSSSSSSSPESYSKSSTTSLPESYSKSSTTSYPESYSKSSTTSSNV
jgi:hypothetical protein